MAYIGVSPSNGVRRVHTYTATASQTTFSGAGAEGTSLSYKDSNFVDVYQNGIKLGDADYTSTSGTSIVLAQGASVDDLVVVVVFDVFSVADTVSKADGGTFDGNVTMGGTLAITGETTLATHLNLGDNDKIKLGASGDLEIFHDGSKSVISDEGTGVLWIAGDSEVAIGNPAVTEYYIRAFKDGAVQLMHDNSTKFATSSGGVTVTGDIANTSGDLTVDVAGDIILDAAGEEIKFQDDGTLIGFVSMENTDLTIQSSAQDRDIIFKGDDGGSGIEAARFDMSEDGALCLGATSRVGAGVLSISFNDAAVHGIDIQVEADSSGGAFAVFRKSSGGVIGQINRNGTSDAVQYTTSSDYRLKENVNYDFDATTTLKKLKPCEFNWISDEKNTTIVGFIAHEVQSVVPNAVNGEKDETEILKDADGKEQTIIKPQGLDKSDLVPLLTKALQEQQATIEALTARIVTLENA